MPYLSLFKINRMNCRAILALIFSIIGFVDNQAQKINIIVNKEIYTSYYSTDLRVPLYVVYYLSNGGG